MPYVLQPVKNMSEQSQVELLSQTYCNIHPSDPCSSSPDEPGKHPVWEIWILLILIYVLEMITATMGEATLLNTVWYHLLIKPMSCPDYFAQRFFSVVKTTHTVKRRRPASLWCHHRCTLPSRIIKIRNHPKHTLVSNQINCSCLKELSLSGAQFDTWVIEVPAQVIIL